MERLLVRYQEENGPLTHDTPEDIKNLARLAAHGRAMRDDPNYRASVEYYVKTGTVHTDHLPPPESEDQIKPSAHLAPKHLSKRTRPSDGKVIGSAFDYDEYLTRRADRLAGDPEYAAKRKARIEARRAKWDKYKEQRDLDGANRDMAEEVKLGEKVGVSRMRQIWHCVWHDESEQRWRTSQKLSQAERIRLAPRVRGCGAAAKRAGF